MSLLSKDRRARVSTPVDVKVRQYWVYSQQCINGHYVTDPERGLAPLVFVEADGPEQANAILVGAGGYFNGVALGLDCPCCGDRWTVAGTVQPASVQTPEVYGFDLDGKFQHPHELLPRSIAALLNHRAMLDNQNDPLACIIHEGGHVQVFTYPKIRVRWQQPDGT